MKKKNFLLARPHCIPVPKILFSSSCDMPGELPAIAARGAAAADLLFSIVAGLSAAATGGVPGSLDRERENNGGRRSHLLF
jgi:hypothetical protein